MKFKVKISALDYKGTMIKFNHVFETPDFEPIQMSFLGHDWIESVERQQEQWLLEDENYQMVIDECERRDLHLIIGFEIIKPKVRKNKKEELKKIIEQLNLSPLSMALVIGTMNDMWPTIKKFNPEKILEIVFESISVTSKVSTSILQDLMLILKGERETIEIVEKHKFLENENSI